MLGISPAVRVTPHRGRHLWKIALDMRCPSASTRSHAKVHAVAHCFATRDSSTTRPDGWTIDRSAAQVARFGRLGFLNAVQMALDGVFERFPSLRCSLPRPRSAGSPGL